MKLTGWIRGVNDVEASSMIEDQHTFKATTTVDLDVIDVLCNRLI